MGSNENICGYILAGGKSSRMGEDKGLLLLNDQAIVQYVIDSLKPLVKKLVIVSNNSAYEKFGYEVIPDEIKNSGPAGGIYTALHHSRSQRNVILSCDMPFISSAAITYLIGLLPEAQITVPIHEGKFEPLFGVYASASAKQWAEEMHKGRLKLQDLISVFDHHIVDVSEHPLFTGHFFTNINTVQDLEMAVKHFDHGN